MFDKQYREAMKPIRLDAVQRASLAETMAREAKRGGAFGKHRRIAGAMAACAVLAAGILVVPAAGRLLDYFEGTRESLYQGYAPVYGLLSEAVGTKVTDQGITVTLEDVSLDSSYLTVFYRVENEDSSPLALESTGDNPEAWTIRHNTGSFAVWINGEKAVKEIDEREAYLEDGRTLRVMERMSLSDEIQDGDQIRLILGWTLRTEGLWSFSFTANQAELTNGQTVYEPGTEIDWPGIHAVVERISMAPTGNTITFVQIEDDGTTPYAGFVLRDDTGAILPLISGIGDGWCSFIGGNDSAFVQLIPVSVEEQLPHWTEPVALDSLPAEGPEENGYRLLSLDIEDDRAVAAYETKGAVAGESAPAFHLLDAEGNVLELAAEGKDFYGDIAIDRSTGVRYLTYYYPNAEIDVPALAEQVCFYCGDTFTIHEEEAVTIFLSGAERD